MTSGTQYNQGDILLVPFPFSDASTVKQRPVLVISRDNDTDLITCGITSNLTHREHSLLLHAADVKEGHLPKPSRIKVDKLFTVEQSVVRRRFGRVSDAVLKEAKRIFHELV